MAIGKRLRFEILRRDNFQCTYCGARPSETELRVDHVIPEALGGQTKPENLTTSCEPCNTGKASVAPDAPLVQSVRQDALRWAGAIQAVAAIRQQEWERRGDYAVQFFDAWMLAERLTYHGRVKVPLPDDWEQSLNLFYGQHLPAGDMEDAVQKTMQTRKVLPDNKFRYFCGICWRTLDQMREAALSLVAVEEAEQSDARLARLQAMQERMFGGADGA